MTHTSTSYPVCPFKIGDRVMFARRCQSTLGGMRVEEVNVNMFDVRLKVDGKWWHPSSFISLEQWQHDFSQPAH